MRTRLNIQKLNAVVGDKQYKVTFVTKVEGREVVDRYAVVEAPAGARRRELIRRIAEIVGRCRIVEGAG